MNYTETDWKRIEDKFERTTEGGCWIWIAGLGQPGYGVIWLDGTYRAAHRVIYEILVGPIPEGKSLLHHCDNRCCVNPTHLYIGTAKDNTRDTKVRGRMAVGTALPQSKLTEDDVREIRKLEGKVHRCELAKQYNVSPRAIVHIWKGATWRHIK